MCDFQYFNYTLYRYLYIIIIHIYIYIYISVSTVYNDSSGLSATMATYIYFSLFFFCISL